MTKLSGQDLTDAIEHELQAMVRDGYEVSPISNKALYLRLISKHVISGSISTLTSSKDVIEHYKKMQLDEVSGTFGQSARSGSTQSRIELIRANAKLREQVEEAKKQVNTNTSTLIDMISLIKATGMHQNIERALSPYFLREIERREIEKRADDETWL